MQELATGPEEVVNKLDDAFPSSSNRKRRDHLHDLHSGPLTSSTLPTFLPPGGGPPPRPLLLPPPKPQPGLLPGVLLLALNGDAAAAAAGSN